LFSKDGSRVYLAPFGDASGLVEVNLDRDAARFIDLRDSIHDRVENLSVSNSGFILCSTKKALWAFDPAKSKCAKVSDFPGGRIQSIAYDPQAEAILATTGSAEFVLPKSGEGFLPLFNRRAPGMAYPVFTAEGSLFFAIHGDLWMGGSGIVREKDDSLHRYGSLAGNRVAPLAALETSECTTDSTGIQDIALSKKYVYARYSRLGGSGWGDLIRFPRPDADRKRGGTQVVPEPRDYWARAKAILGSVEKLEDCPAACYLCASSKGDVVFFLNHALGEHSMALIIQNDGKPEVTKISGLAAVLGWK
jgi:hypothetical protein